jgi:hypothetical protein
MATRSPGSGVRAGQPPRRFFSIAIRFVRTFSDFMSKDDTGQGRSVVLQLYA